MARIRLESLLQPRRGLLAATGQSAGRPRRFGLTTNDRTEAWASCPGDLFSPPFSACLPSPVASCSGTHFEQRNQAAPLRPLFTRYNSAFFYRHNDAFRFSAGVHFAHAKQHDVLQLTELSDAFYQDPAFDAECLDFVYDPPRTEPHMFYWGPHVGQFAWKLYRAIDWTHVHQRSVRVLICLRDWLLSARLLQSRGRSSFRSASLSRGP